MHLRKPFSLPPDILYEIFMHVLSISQKRLKLLLGIGSVCRLWKIIVLSLPFWKNTANWQHGIHVLSLDSIRTRRVSKIVINQSCAIKFDTLLTFLKGLDVKNVTAIDLELPHSIISDSKLIHLITKFKNITDLRLCGYETNNCIAGIDSRTIIKFSKQFQCLRRVEISAMRGFSSKSFLALISSNPSLQVIIVNGKSL